MRVSSRLTPRESSLHGGRLFLRGAILAVDAVPSAHDLVWITVAMIGARSLAMALNRLIDAEIDARNPRTAGRELPAGRLSRVQVVARHHPHGPPQRQPAVPSQKVSQVPTGCASGPTRGSGSC